MFHTSVHPCIAFQSVVGLHSFNACACSASVEGAFRAHLIVPFQGEVFVL